MESWTEPTRWLFIALAVAIGWLCWVAVVHWWYRPRSAPAVRLWAVAEDGWRIAVYARAAAVRRWVEPVLLCHGFAINRDTFELDPPHSLAHSLSQAGFDCYTVEWRGTGASWRPPHGLWPSFTIDDHVGLDAPAVLATALAGSSAPSAFWVGHSLGGLIGYAAAEGPTGARLKGLVSLGAPVFFHYGSLMRRAVTAGAFAAWPLGLRHRLLALSVAPLLGYLRLPLSELIINPAHVAPRTQRRLVARALAPVGRNVLVQLRDWVDHDAFRSFDRQVDYRARLPRLKLPTLVAGGSQDRLAPPEVLQAQHELIGSSDKTLVVFGKDRGDAVDYGHGDLVFGEGAPSEVYPLIQRWLEARATPLRSSRA